MTLPNGANPIKKLIVGGDEFLYADGTETGGGGRRIYKIHPVALTVENSFDTGSEVTLSLDYSFEGGPSLYAGFDNGTVERINPANMSSVEVYNNTTYNITAMTFENNSLYVGESDDALIQQVTTTDLTLEPNHNLNINAPNGDILLNGASDVGGSPSGNQFILALDTDNNNQIVYSSSSDLTLSSALSDHTSSSRRYKREINNIENYHKNLLENEPVSFKFNDGRDSDLLHFGVIAEELVKWLPNLVRYNNEGQVEGVRYIEMIPLLLKIAQDQQIEINELRSMVEAAA